MKVNAVIAEYNPFHNGHRYQLEASKQLTGADYTIVAVSGNFMQRGTPALLHKYARARMALLNGADLVLEIPAFYACGSAEFFAKGAVAMLDQLGVVDHLCFGSECGDVDSLAQIAQILASEPEDYREHLSVCLGQGLSFPAARAKALEKVSPALTKYFAAPNNILGIEYLKALISRKSSITPVTIKRLGAGYHDAALDTTPARNGDSTPAYASALAIRQAVFAMTGNSQDGYFHPDFSQSGCSLVPQDQLPPIQVPQARSQMITALKAQMPESSCEILQRHLSEYSPLQADDFSQLLLYKLLSEEAHGYEKYLDVTPDLSDKIRKNLFQFTDFTDFCSLLKSKDNTHTRLNRSLLHILLDITTAELQSYQAMDYTPYARILGLRKDAAPLLSAMKQNTSIPLISKLADAGQVLEGAALTMLRRDIQISHIYNGVEAQKKGGSIRNEYRTPIVTI